MAAKRCGGCGAELNLGPARCPLCGTEGSAAPRSKVVSDVESYQQNLCELREQLRKLREDAEAV
ncbi:MAG: hypothetical protein ABR529_09170 [Actinomycetota bacterium]